MDSPANETDNPIAAFLDQVDRVLNSNSFLLSFDVLSEDQLQALRSFIDSDSFVEQIVRQDLDRGWYNLQYYDEHMNSYRVRKGTLVKRGELHLSKAHPNKLEYLVAMLTGDISQGKFFSFYRQQLKYEDAKRLTKAFIEFLFKGEAWELFTLEPNFLTNAEEVHSPDEIFYFERDDGNNTATMITSGTNGYLLLTNGID